MNIIICGAGRVGFTIAKQLSEQGHSITVIDQSSEDIQKIDEALDVKAFIPFLSPYLPATPANAINGATIIFSYFYLCFFYNHSSLLCCLSSML